VIEFTTLIALDKPHVEELKITWPTWMKFRPEIKKNPLVVLCDVLTLDHEWRSLLEFLEHPQRKIVLVPPAPVKTLTQRGRMLSSFVLYGPKAIETKWYLKLDTDTIATQESNWCKDEWFEDDPVFITSPWGYTKPADTLEKLDNWADNVTGLKEYPRLNLPYDPSWSRIKHGRIISYVFFGRAEWSRRMAEIAGGVILPWPSQDTYLWYCAARRKEFYRLYRMKKFGWGHVSRQKSLREIRDRVLNEGTHD